MEGVGIEEDEQKLTRSKREGGIWSNADNVKHEKAYGKI